MCAERFVCLSETDEYTDHRECADIPTANIGVKAFKNQRSSACPRKKEATKIPFATLMRKKKRVSLRSIGVCLFLSVLFVLNSYLDV